MGRRWSRPRWERKGHGRPHWVLSVLASRVLWAPVAGYSEYFPTGDSGAVLGVLPRIAPRLPPRSLYPFLPRLNLARTLAPTPPHDFRRVGCPPQLVVRASHCSCLAHVVRRASRTSVACSGAARRKRRSRPAVPPRLPRHRPPCRGFCAGPPPPPPTHTHPACPGVWVAPCRCRCGGRPLAVASASALAAGTKVRRCS